MLLCNDVRCLLPEFFTEAVRCKNLCCSYFMSDFVIVSFLSYVLSVVLFVLLFLSVILCDCAFLSCFFITPPIPPPTMHVCVHLWQ